MLEVATVKTSKAAVGYQYFNRLFTLEKKCADQKAKYRREYRQNIILPVLEEYFCWLDALDPEKGSKLEDAVRYSRNQKRRRLTELILTITCSIHCRCCPTSENPHLTNAWKP